MILSVVVPTYNRVDYLEVMLNSVLEQISAFNLEKDVEIIISDNDSSDGTGDYVNNLINKNKHIKIIYRKNEKNIGAVRNIAKLVSYAAGKYWMFHGDDDLMVKGALPEIIESLKNHPEVPVFVFKHKNYKGIEGDELLSIYECASRYFYYMGNIATIANTELSKRSLEKHFDEIISTCWPQTHLYYLCMYESNIPKPIKICNIVTYEVQTKNHNNILNSFYCFDSYFYALFRVAYMIAETAGDKSFLSYFKKGIPLLNQGNYIYLLSSVIRPYHLFDLDKERSDLKKTLREAYKTLKFIDIFYLIPFSLSILIPRPLYFFIHLVSHSIFASIKERSVSNFVNNYKEERERVIIQRQDRIQKMKLKHAITINRGEW